MTFRVLDEAEAEYREAAHWYDSRQPGVGHDFIAEITHAFEEINRDPSRYPLVEMLSTGSREFRRCLLRRFPYYVVFLICADEVLVVAVAHGSREPGYWMGRGHDR